VTDTTAAKATKGRTPRPYNSPVRQQRAAETRSRIITAGSELVHQFASWDWRELTFRAVAERAGVGERTVYRHFPTERHLHDAVMKRLHEEAGIDYDRIRLATLTKIAGRMFRSMRSFAVGQSVVEPNDPTFQAVDEQRRAALRRAVEEAAPDWNDRQRETTAAVLDVLWHVPSYERLVSAWQFDPDRATRTLAWMIDLVVDAVERDEPPPAR
jgi:AcrR family transcriptional regulator